MQPKPAPAILLIRPVEGSKRFAEALRDALGDDVKIVISPLTKIEFLEGALELDGLSKLIFTSTNGVRAYARHCERRDIPCYSVGDATAAYARSIGMQATSCHGNAQDLIARILADGERGPVLHVRGVHSRGEVALNLQNAGCKAEEAIVYRQIGQILNDAAISLFQAKTPVIVPLFSPRGAEQFVQQYHGGASVLVVVMSAAVAQAVRDLDALRVVTAQSPNREAMLEAIKGLLVAD
ncbi:MAG: uroporphyrinogen-III synthase [Rhodobacterales bacterium]|nr:uroporphyrinogen-III synthase [Rhodobacterales bacterium]